MSEEIKCSLNTSCDTKKELQKEIHLNEAKLRLGGVKVKCPHCGTFNAVTGDKHCMKPECGKVFLTHHPTDLNGSVKKCLE